METFAEQEASGKGISFNEVPDIYAIMISAFDPFKGNHTIYHIHRTIEELNQKA